MDIRGISRPHEQYRGRIEGFPNWPPLQKFSPSTGGDLLTGTINWLTANVGWLDPARWEHSYPGDPSRPALLSKC